MTTRLKYRTTTTEPGTCAACGGALPAPRSTLRRYCLDPECGDARAEQKRTARSASWKTWREANPEKQAESRLRAKERAKAAFDALPPAEQDAARVWQRAKEFAKRSGGASYTDYLTLRERGICSICGKDWSGGDEPSSEVLHSHVVYGVVVGVKCSQHNVDVARVREGLASPIGALADYLKLVYA